MDEERSACDDVLDSLLSVHRVHHDSATINADRFPVTVPSFNGIRVLLALLSPIFLHFSLLLHRRGSSPSPSLVAAL